MLGERQRMKSKLLFLVLLLTSILVACGGGEAVAPAAVENDGIELSQLPQTIDVETVQALQNRDDVLLIDVREQWEYDEKHIPNITLIPMGEVPNRLDEIPKDKTVILTCRSGNRSGQVTDFLRQNGYANAHNMEGGIIAWEEAGYEVEK